MELIPRRSFRTWDHYRKARLRVEAVLLQVPLLDPLLGRSALKAALSLVLA